MKNKCVCCESIDWKIIPYTKICSYLKCNTCGYYIQDHQLTSGGKDQFELEQEKYYGEHSMILQEEPNIMERDIIKERIKIINKFLKKNGSILEVGPGGGGVLRELISAGHNVTAIEHSEYLAENLRKLNANVIVGEFEKIDKRELLGKYDAFCSFHVIEHVNDVLVHLKNARELIISGGLAFIATPNAESWENVLPFKLSPNLDTAHFQLFSPSAMRICLEKSGWKLIFIKTPEYTFSWLRVITKIVRRIRNRDESLTAGEYAKNFSTTKKLAYKIFKLLSYPIRILQQALKSGNELFIVAKRVD